MEKKSLKVLAVIFLIVLGVFLFFILREKTLQDAIKFKEEYEEVNSNEGAVQLTVSEDNPIVYLNSYGELEEKISNQDSFILYLGFPTCPWCRNIIPILFEIVSKNKIKDVYYINVRELKNTNQADYDSLYQLMDDYLEADENGNKVLYVPDVFFFQDGKVVGHHVGSVESQTSPLVPLTEEQKLELKNIYQEYIDKIQ